MERQKGIGKRILALFLLISIVGGMFGNFSSGASIQASYSDYKSSNNGKTYKYSGNSYMYNLTGKNGESITILTKLSKSNYIERTSGSKTTGYSYGYLEEVYYGADAGRTIMFTQPGFYAFRFLKTTLSGYIYDVYSFSVKHVYAESKNISGTVNKTYSESLPKYLSGLGTFLTYDKPSGLTIDNDGTKINFKPTKEGTYKVTFKNKDDSYNYSDYKGSECTYTITAKKASSSNNSSFRDFFNQIGSGIIGNTTQTYNPYISIGSITSETPKKYMSKRKVTFTVSSKEISGSLNVSVTGKSSGNMNVSSSANVYTFYVTKNDTFTISAKGTGKDGKSYSDTETVLVEGMDTTKPTIDKCERVATRGTNQVKLNITVSDNKRLATVKVYDPDGNVIKEEDYSGREGVSSGETRDITVEKINKKGKYKVEVKDEAGNECTHTQDVHVDTTAPTVKAFSVTKVDDKGKSISTEEEGISSISATTGDQILLKIWIHEMLSEIENPIIKIDGKTIEELGGSFEVNCEKNASGHWLTKVTFTMSDKLTKSQFLPIVIGTREDLWENATDEEIVYDNMLYYDEEQPIIKNCTFSGTTYAGKEISSKFIQITDKNTIKVSFVAEEILSKDAIVTLMGVEQNIKSTTYTKVAEGYQYTAEFKFTKEQLEASQNKGIQEVVISNCVDKAGNTLPEVKCLEDSSKNVIITSGLIDGGIYLDITNGNQEEITEFKVGDANKNGYITSFDYIYQKVNINEIGKDVGDINQDGNVNETDLEHLDNLLNNTRTTVKGDTIKVKLYAYEDNTYKVGIVNSFDDLILSDNVELDRENSNLTEGIVAVKVLNDQENIIIRAGQLYGVLRIDNIEGDSEKIEEIQQVRKEGKGCIVLEDRDIFYNKKEISGKTEGNTRLGYHEYDINDDGIITSYDAIMIQTFAVKGYAEDSDEYKFISEYGDLNKDGSIDSYDAWFINKAIVDQYSKIVKGDSVKLKFIANNGSLHNNELRYDSLEWETLDENIATLVKNEDGTATIKAVGKVGEHTQILVKAIRDGVSISAATFNIEIDDLQINMEKMADGATTSIEEDIKEVTLNQTNKETAKLSIGNISTIGKNVTWEIEDENIATLIQTEEVENEQTKTVIIEPKKIGKTKVRVNVSGEDNQIYTSTIDLVVENNIEKVILYHNGEAVNETPIKLHINEIYDFSILTIPLQTSESYEISVDNGEILELSKNNEGYIIKALEEGEANIVIKAEKGEVKYPVYVMASKNPEIVSITAVEKDKILKAGDKITITVEFDQNIKGDVPEMKLYFDENEALGKLEGIIEGNKIIYTYEIEEEDNGQLYVGEITLAEGKVLTDERENAEANLNIIGLYNVEGIYVWQKTPELEVNLIPSGDSFEVKEGDTVTINISASKDLKYAPILKVANKEIKTTGKGSQYEAIVKITKGVIPEGRLKVEVDAVEDIYGNVSESKEVNNTVDIDTVIVDYTKPTINNIRLENYTEDLKEGDKIKIKVTFADKTKGTTETVLMPTKEVNGEIVNVFPTMKLLFGGKEAKGNMTVVYEETSLKQTILNDPEKIEAGEDETTIENIELPYSDTIIYAYTLTKEDKGDIAIKSISGTVYDMAGNESKLDYVNKNNNSEEKEDNIANKNEQENNVSNKLDKDNLATGKLPHAGATLGTGIISIIIGVISLILRKRWFVK